MTEKLALEEKEHLDTEQEEALKQIKNDRTRKSLISILKAMEDSEASREAEEFKKEIAKKAPQPEQQTFSFLPHQMAKTSIFFPMSDRELNEENRKINRLEHETSWGKIVIDGIKLAIFEEDIFLALIKLAKGHTTMVDGFPTLETTMNELVNILYGASGYTKQSFERIERALQHFQLVRFELTTFDWQKKGNERLKTMVVRSIGNIVHKYEYTKKTKYLKIKFNPDFFAYFLESMLTNINLTLRRKLKRDGSKALLRFLSTHNKPTRMHILTVLNAINFNINQPMFRLRERLKNFIKELKINNVIGAKTKVFNDDTVFFDIISDKKELT
jgi:hypothetical protein